MTVEATQALLLALGGAGICWLSVVSTRRGLLGLRYGIGWLSVSILVFLTAAAGATGFVEPVARRLRLTPTGFILLGVAAFLLLLCFQMSVALSRLEKTTRTLLREVALVRAEIQPVPAVDGPGEAGGADA